MKRIAALMPTRNRAATATKAMSSFIEAFRTVAADAQLRLVVSDDSDMAIEREALLTTVANIKSLDPLLSVDVVTLPSGSAGGPTISHFGAGPGAARNRALAHLREGPDDHDVLIMFDDDIYFADVDYRGQRLKNEGPAVIRDALGMCELAMAVAGCEYVGRQDLSILEHISLDTTGSSSCISPALERADIRNLAPGGISTAFLAVAAPAWCLPNFPEHYNEDYVWLHALKRAGWPLLRTTSQLAHVPPGDVAVDAISLSYQVFGEIVWLAISEQDRFPLDRPHSLAGAVKEIVGDLRAVHRDLDVAVKPAIGSVVSLVLSHYESVLVDIAEANESLDASAMMQAITQGLELKPIAPHDPCKARHRRPRTNPPKV